MIPYARSACIRPNQTVDGPPIVQLRRNYRSHPALTRLPSQLFYNDSLVAAADAKTTHSLLPWEELEPGEQFPLLFYGVLGRESRAIGSPSIANSAEVLGQLHRLLSWRRLPTPATPPDALPQPDGAADLITSSRALR